MLDLSTRSTQAHFRDVTLRVLHPRIAASPRHKRWRLATTQRSCFLAAEPRRSLEYPAVTPNNLRNDLAWKLEWRREGSHHSASATSATCSANLSPTNNAERFHQALDGQLVRPPATASNDNAMGSDVRCRSRLGGLLSFYHREAA